MSAEIAIMWESFPQRKVAIRVGEAFLCPRLSHIVLLADVTNSLEGESSHDWVFEISKDRYTGYSLGHADV